MSPWGFRILSANLARARENVQGFGRLLEAVEPDVVVVQELGPRQADAIARVLPFGRLEPAKNDHGMGIALRAPGSVRRLPLPFRSAFVAEVAGPEGEGPIEVLNLHLAAPHMPPLLQRLRDRRAQLREIIAYLDGTPRLRRVLAGDLNATPLWPAYRHLRTRLDDAVLEAARRTGNRPGRTWGPRSSSLRVLRVDHVLVKGLVAWTTRVLPLPGGDHSALVVDLGLPPG